MILPKIQGTQFWVEYDEDRKVGMAAKRKVQCQELSCHGGRQPVGRLYFLTVVVVMMMVKLMNTLMAMIKMMKMMSPF